MTGTADNGAGGRAPRGGFGSGLRPRLAGPLSRLSIAGHLRAGLLGISLFVLLAAAAGLFAFLEVSRALNDITHQRVPATLAAQELARRAQGIADAAPKLLAADSEAAFTARWRMIESDMQRLQSLAEHIKAQGLPGSDGSLPGMAARLAANLRSLNTAVARNLSTHAQITARLHDWSRDYRATLRLIEPVVRTSRSRLLELEAALTTFEPGSEAQAAVVSDLDRLLHAVIPLQDIRVRLARANDRLLAVATSSDAAAVTHNAGRFGAQLEALAELMADLDADTRALLAPRIDGLDAYIGGPEGLPELRRRELSSTAAAEQLLAQNQDMSQALGASVDRIVQEADEEIEAATDAALQTQITSAVVLLAVVVLSFVSALVIIRAYVERRVIHRLSAIRDSMLALSRGELDRPLPAADSDDELGRMTQALQVFRDNAIGLRDRSRELQAARDEAVASNEAKSRFLANMSHELRTPLNAVLGFSEIIRDEVVGPIGQPRYREYAQDIHDSAAHLLDLINDILDVAKAEAGKLELQEEELDVAQTLSSCRRLVQERADQGRVRLRLDLPSASPALLADERRVKQILLNLLTNAIKFTPDGGEVSIALEREDDGGVAIIVADTGIGMSPAELETAVAPFSQIDNAVSRRVEGTGLGLPLTKHLLEMHGGDLRLDSEKGTGTRACACFPASRVRPAPATVRASAD